MNSTGPRLDDEKWQALKAPMLVLGVDLPDDKLAELTTRHDGVTPMKRFRDEEGPWVPAYVTRRT